MNAGFLLIPLFLMRYLLLHLLDKKALRRAAFVPPLLGQERVAFVFYQLATLALPFYCFFLHIHSSQFLFWSGLIIYFAGVLLMLFACISFARPAENGLLQHGFYRFSRNPIYLAVFVYFFGIVLLTKSWLLLVLLAVFQFSEHWIILAEERWCRQQFGAPYLLYQQQVRRYF